MMDGLALPTDNKRGPNCGVTCVAIVAGRPFAEVWSFMAKSAGRTGRWKGWTTDPQRREALDHFGVRYVDVSPKRGQPLRTLQTFARLHMDGATYMVRTCGHVQLIRDGVVVDQSGPRPVALHWGRNKRVTHVHRIVREA